MKQDVGMHFCIIPNPLILSGRKGAYLGQEELVYTTEWPHFTQYYNGQTGQGEGM